MNILVNQEISVQSKQEYCTMLSKLISNILSKPELYVMIIIQDKQTISMSGNNEPACYIELKSLGLPEDKTSQFSAEICESVSSLLNISIDRIYIEFTNGQRHLWGWNGGTF